MSVVLIAALVWQVIDFLRELTHLPTEKSAVLTQLCAWVGGIAVIALAAHAQVTQTLVFPGTDAVLGKLDGGSIVLLGLMASSLASSAYDVKNAVDNTDSAAKPPLLG